VDADKFVLNRFFCDVVGFEQITPANHEVGILTRGLAFHSIGDRSRTTLEHTCWPTRVHTPSKAKFVFSTGSAAEEVSKDLVVRQPPAMNSNSM
jgi:hypothetical protein